MLIARQELVTGGRTLEEGANVSVADVGVWEALGFPANDRAPGGTTNRKTPIVPATSEVSSLVPLNPEQAAMKGGPRVGQRRDWCSMVLVPRLPPLLQSPSLR